MNELLKANPGFQVLYFNDVDGPVTRQDVIAWKREHDVYYPVTLAGVFLSNYVRQPCGSVYLPNGGLFDNEDEAKTDWLRSIGYEKTADQMQADLADEAGGAALEAESIPHYSGLPTGEGK